MIKLYVWEGALADWTGGIIVALAPNLRAAKTAARNAYGRNSLSSGLESDLAVPPQVVKITDGTPAQAWFVHGGC